MKFRYSYQELPGKKTERGTCSRELLASHMGKERALLMEVDAYLTGDKSWWVKPGEKSMYCVEVIQ